MCDKCKPQKKYWLHIADSWAFEEQREMTKYLQTTPEKREHDKVWAEINAEINYYEDHT